MDANRGAQQPRRDSETPGSHRHASSGMLLTTKAAEPAVSDIIM